MVPNEWRKGDLKEYISVKHGFAFKSAFFSSSGDLVLLTPGSFHETGGFRDQGSKTKYYLGEVPEGYLLAKGDMLLAMTEQAEGLLGSALFVPENGKYLHNQRLGLVQITDQNRVCLDFLYLFFNSPSSRKQITEQSTGTKVKHTSPDRLCSVIGLIPPLFEQRKIAQILSTWDKAITTTEQLLANSQQQKKALMQQLLTGKKRLPGFNGEWEEHSIGELLRQVKRPVVWNDDVDYKLLSVKRRSEGVVLREVLRGHDIKTKKMNLAHAGDFLISKMQILHGASGLVTQQHHKHHISDSYIALEPKENDSCDMEFFSWFSKQKLMYHKAYLCSYGVHIEKMTFNFNMYLKEKILVPVSVEEQRAVANTLNKAENEIETLLKKLAFLKQEKKALMQQLLTGKRRVKVEDAA